MDSILKPYMGRVPACGIFCGGCPVYIRDKKPCSGAEINLARCEKCKSYHLCCKEKGVTHCYQCNKFPCSRLRTFAKNWLKYGQNMIENQQILKLKGVSGFLTYYNEQVI